MDLVTAAQSRAAHAYAEAMLGPELADPAAEDALAAFRQTVSARGDAVGTSTSPAGDQTLLALTRLMTAVSMPDRSSPEDRRQAVWASISAGSHCTCRESAALLATRANGNIQPRESAALDEHLGTCADCRELSVQSGLADAAFYEQLKPATGGGFSLPGAPPAVFALASVLISAGVVAIALAASGGGSHTTSSRTGRVLGVQTQTATSVDLRLVTAGAAGAAKSVAHHAPAVKAKTHHTTVTHTATTSRPATSRAAAVTSAAAAVPTSDAAPVEPATSVTPAADNATAAPGNSSAGATPASSTAVVSGQSSLPADSAPQHGIGNLTSTTP